MNKMNLKDYNELFDGTSYCPFEELETLVSHKPRTITEKGKEMLKKHFPSWNWEKLVDVDFNLYGGID